MTFSLFSGPAVPDPVDVSLEYLALCKEYPGTVSIKNIQTHVRHFLDFQCSRRPWFNKFRGALCSTASVEEVEHLLRVKVERWRGRRPRSLQGPCLRDGHAETEQSSCESDACDYPLGDITSQSWPLEFASSE